MLFSYYSPLEELVQDLMVRWAYCAIILHVQPCSAASQDRKFVLSFPGTNEYCSLDYIYLCTRRMAVYQYQNPLLSYLHREAMVHTC